MPCTPRPADQFACFPEDVTVPIEVFQHVMLTGGDNSTKKHAYKLRSCITTLVNCKWLAVACSWVGDLECVAGRAWYCCRHVDLTASYHLRQSSERKRGPGRRLHAWCVSLILMHSSNRARARLARCRTQLRAISHPLTPLQTSCVTSRLHSWTSKSLSSSRGG